MPSAQSLLFALVGGILPALFWLWFWLREDRARPEPRGLILLAFLAGMIIIPFVILLEQWATYYAVGTVLIVLWAAIEEGLKFSIGKWLLLGRKANDEPIDAIIYMITIALGFAAIENTLFLLNPLLDGKIVDTILTGNLRFLGATLLHVLASATVGMSMAFAFYKSKLIKIVCVGFGLFLAIVLHSAFNLFIIESNGEKVLLVFLFVWIGIITLLILFEKVKAFYNRDLIK
jgi:protease PrsW